MCTTTRLGTLHPPLSQMRMFTIIGKDTRLAQTARPNHSAGNNGCTQRGSHGKEITLPPIKDRSTPGIPAGYKEAPTPTPTPQPTTVSVNPSRDMTPTKPPNFVRTNLPPVWDSHPDSTKNWTNKNVPQQRIYARVLNRGTAATPVTPPPPIASTQVPGVVKPNGSSITVDTGTGQIGVNSQHLNTRFYNAGVGAQIQAGSTIAPTHSYHHVTGSTPITHITVPQGMSAGNSVVLIPDSAGEVC
jgi:hypothetical protein